MPNNRLWRILAGVRPQTKTGRYRMNDLPIRDKLIIHFLLIIILPSVLLGGSILWTVDRIIEKQVSENTLQLIGKVNKTLEAYAGNMQNITYFLSFQPEVKRFLERGPGAAQRGAAAEEYEIRQFMQGFTTLYPEVAGVLLVNAQGDYISNEMYARSSRSLTEEEWYKQAVASKGIFTMVGHPHGRNVTTHVSYKDSEVVSAVRAILDPQTQAVKGVVLIDLKLRVIAETAKDVRLGKSGYLTIIDDQGDVIYAPPRPLVSRIPGEWLEDHGSGTFAQEVGGEKLQFIYRASPFTNWTTVGVFSMEESALEAQEIGFYVVCFVFIVCLFGIAASYYLSHSISRPIVQLMSFMRIAESGDLTVRYWGDRRDEVGNLGRSFNTMIAQIDKLLTLTERQERQKREAELRSLQAHIKPHFLYNTLDTIHWMARKKGAEDVAEVVQSLSRLFRIGLSKGSDRILLAHEIEHICSYLTIQKSRYKDKLNYTIDVPEHLLNVSVLKIVLQPIVENAIYHGIKERRGPGHIAVEAEERWGLLLLRVRDDGAGMDAEKLRELQERLAASPASDDEQGEPREPVSYGMMNVQARIQLAFGSSYGLTIESEAGRGTTVTIIHPLLRDGLQPVKRTSEGGA
ncbi:cache domain-containing sensor histidine kinase [Paenibacillus sp. S-38]|uniref:cache domain-containing sensor histidine kinase n=1 Tax=Paenibacillus sp. S-38 TaxID=3416710 RepID=UPI003CE87A21